MRRISAGFIAFVVLTATFLILPVYAAPTPEAVPVETSAEEIAMGSVEAPAAEAEVQEGENAQDLRLGRAVAALPLPAQRRVTRAIEDADPPR